MGLRRDRNWSLIETRDASAVQMPQPQLIAISDQADAEMIARLVQTWGIYRLPGATTEGGNYFRVVRYYNDLQVMSKDYARSRGFILPRLGAEF